jgi:hypothetical protein
MGMQGPVLDITSLLAAFLLGFTVVLAAFGIALLVGSPVRPWSLATPGESPAWCPAPHDAVELVRSQTRNLSPKENLRQQEQPVDVPKIAKDCIFISFS